MEFQLIIINGRTLGRVRKMRRKRKRKRRRRARKGIGKV
jgi:hypothetical protein